MADDRVDALFTLPPEDFTAARNDLARQLRGAGERDRAKEVTKLRRPTVAAWAVNQAVRADREAYEALLDAGRELRRAQRRALSGMTKSGLRDASRARRQHIERMAGQAAGVVAEAGGDPAPHRDDILATFDAASATDEAGEEVGAARLSKPMAAPSTFDDLAALSVVEPEPGPADESAAVAEQAGERGAAPDDADEERRAAADALATARRRAGEAASARRRAHDDADAARREADDAAGETERAVAAAEKAQRDADLAQREADRARREAERQQHKAEAADRHARRRADEAASAGRAAEDRARELEEAEERLRALGDDEG